MARCADDQSLSKTTFSDYPLSFQFLVDCYHTTAVMSGIGLTTILENICGMGHSSHKTLWQPNGNDVLQMMASINAASYVRTQQLAMKILDSF